MYASKGIKLKKGYSVAVVIGGRKAKIRETKSKQNRERKIMVQFIKLKEKFKKNKFWNDFDF